MYFHLTGTITDPSKLAPYRDDEVRVFGELRTEGVVLHAFRRSDEPTIIYLIVAAEHDEEAREQMARLPFVDKGLLTFDYAEVTEM